MYLYHKITERLIAGKPFLYQTNEGTVFHVGQGVVNSISSWRSEENIVAFVDGDEGVSKPKSVLINPKVQIIVASSPKGVNQKWIKQTGNHTSFTKIATSLWLRHELHLAGLVLPFFLSTLD